MKTIKLVLTVEMQAKKQDKIYQEHINREIFLQKMVLLKNVIFAWRSRTWNCFINIIDIKMVIEIIVLYVTL
jgi:hypothetical protein